MKNNLAYSILLSFALAIVSHGSVAKEAAPPGAPDAVFNGGQQELPRTQLRAGMHVISAEIADNMSSRSNGLMMRHKMAANEGMLFVFEQPQAHCFWMRNTLLPLSIAFLDDDGVIVNIADMQPKSDESHCAKKPVRYALEMNQGWFAKKAIKADSKIAGLKK